MRKIFLISVLVLLSFSFFASVTPVEAGTIHLTNNEFDDWYPNIDNEKVVWVSEGQNIFLHDLASGTTTQISNGGHTPQIKDGKVVYLGIENGNFSHKIFLYDITTGTTIQIADNNNSEEPPAISNGKVIWAGNGHPINEIFLYDIATGITTQLTNNSQNNYRPQINNGKAVWESDGSADGVYLYDIASMGTTKISNEGWGAQINSEKVVYANNGEIFVYDITTGITTSIANNFNGDYDYPRINNGKVVWMGWRNDSPYEEIFFYDLATGITAQLTNNEYWDARPKINDNKITWMGYGYYDSADSEIFVYDISTGVTTQVTDNNLDDSSPLTSDGKIVWGRYDGNDGEIMLWDETIPDNTAPIIDELQNLTINLGESYTATGSFTDTTSSSWSATVEYGDGSGVQALTLNGTSFELNHAYTSAGTYTVTVIVTDDGGLSDTETAEVTVTDPQPVTLYPTSDTFLKEGSPNQNEGASTLMRIQSAGHNRAMIKFDQSQIAAAVNGAQNYTAKLQMTITDNGNNWGTTGRALNLHRMTQDWTEGNGFIENNNPIDKGTGNGTTWNCATDSDITNGAANCSGADDWNMSNSSLWPFASAVTAATTITNNQSGVVEFDVTADVQSYISGTNQNYGWLLKKENEGQNGRVEFGTKESGNTPVLVISFN